MRSTLCAAGLVVIPTAVLAFAGTARGQTASAIVRVGDLIPGTAATVSSVTQTAVNHIGGYAVNVNTSDSLSRVIGDFAGGPLSVLATEGTFGMAMQTSFEAFFGIGDSTVAYSPLSTVGAATGLDGVFRDGTLLAIEQQPHPILPGQFWSFGSRPSVTSNGQVWFVGGITATAGGSTQNRGLFTAGNSDSVVLVGGQTVPGYAEPLNSGTTVDFDFRVSGSGNHYLAPVVLTGGTATDAAVVMDGAAAMAGGSVLREGTLIPVGAGGNGTELYQAFDFMGITDSGEWLVTGDSNGATTADEFVMYNGVIVLRDGAMIGSDTVQGDIEGAYLNNDGDWAVIWDTVGNTIETLIVNGRIILREGDAVDFDGDGVAEPDAILTQFTGTSSLTMSDRRNAGVDVYFIGTASVGGGANQTGAFRVRLRLFGEADVNCDGALTAADCDAMALALADPPAYGAMYPDCDISQADLNMDGKVNFFDIEPFCQAAAAANVQCDLCPQNPCPCDWDGSGTLNSQDFFTFITDFFAVMGDFNGDGMTTSQDFFDFLNCFFDGCP